MEEELYLLIAEGKIKELIHAIRKSPNIVNTSVVAGKTCLHSAVEIPDERMTRSLEMVKYILSVKQIDVNKQEDEFKQTALHVAVIQPGTPVTCKVVEALLEHKDICTDIVDADGRNALHHAVMTARPPKNYKCKLTFNSIKFKIVDLLLRKGGFDINEKDKAGKSALHYAVYKSAKRLHIFKTLIARNDISVTGLDTSGFTVLHYAAMKATNYPHLSCLLESGKIDINILDSKGRTALHIATMKRTKEANVKILLSNGININIQDKSGKSALHYACLKQKKEKLINYFFLTAENIDVNLKDTNEKTPLHYAAAGKNNVKVLKTLMRHRDIKLNETDITGQTPLHYCSKIADVDMLKALLENELVDVNIKDNDGKTVLHNCAELGVDLNLVNIIIKRGNNIASLRDQQGDLAADCAKRNGHNEISDFLVTRYRGECYLFSSVSVSFL